MHSHEQDDWDDDDFVSKSARKREAHAAQEMGERLVELDDAALKRLDLPDNLLIAIRQARTIKARGGRKRQLQYIGKLMRSVDFDAIGKALEELDPASPQAVRLQHECERWRAQLIEEGAPAVTAFVDAYPDVDVQQLRQLLRQVEKERSGDYPPRYQRELFRWLRDQIGGAT